MCPRPRFAQLDPERRRAILDVAAEEFAVHGLERSSYNRIIRNAGVSKGAMYYYFDDKADLFHTTVLDVMERGRELMGTLGEVVPADVDDPRGFWAALGDFNQRLWALFATQPVLVGICKALLDDRVGATQADVLVDVIAEMRGAMGALVERGRELGAVRSDVDAELLTSVLLALGESIDRWIVPRWQSLDADTLAGLPALALDFSIRAAAPTAALPDLLTVPTNGAHV